MDSILPRQMAWAKPRSAKKNQSPPIDGSVLYFAVKSISLSKLNGRKPCDLITAARHNLREIQAELGAVGRIDASRMHLNRVLQGAETAAGVKAYADELLSVIDASKLRKDHCQAIEAVFSLPPAAIVEAGAFFESCLQWIKVAMGLPVLSAVVHFDEGADHMHVLLLPLLDGVHVGGGPITQAKTKKLNDRFFNDVAGPAGFKRANAKMYGQTKKWGIDAVLKRCRDDGIDVGAGALWPFVEAAIRANPLQPLECLGIDPRSVRPPDDKPIGIELVTPKDQSLSLCRDHQNNPAPTFRISTKAETAERLYRSRMARLEKLRAAMPVH